MQAEELVDKAKSLYPESHHAHAESHRARVVFQLKLVRDFLPPKARIMDVGGGISAFAPALALAGYQVVVVDDLGDPTAKALDMELVFKRANVELRRQDASADTFEVEPGEYDLISCIDSIEHWHRSPKSSLHKMCVGLKRGARLMIGVPNCSNLRKRITGLFGRNKWTSMQDWYELPEFRAHVREPDVDDLRYIARDLGLDDVRILGRNWSGHMSPKPSMRLLTRVSDPILKMRPSLCSDLYMLGRRAAAA